MATTPRRPRKNATTKSIDPFAGLDTAIPGEVLITLAPAAADAMTASVPTHPSGPPTGTNVLGVSELDSVLADLGAHDITRLAGPSPAGTGNVLGTMDDGPGHVLGRSFRVRIDPTVSVDAAVTQLNKVGSVEIAEPNRWRFTQVVPNDPRYGEQWGLPKINAPAAWDKTTGSASVIVAVVDTGVDLTHPDLAPLLVPGYDMVDLGTNPTPPAGWRYEGDFSGRDSVPADEVGHGTHVSGTIAALSNNGVGVAGVTWQCRIMPVKALTRLVRISDGRVSGTGSSADVAAAVRWAADNGASVINMSLGSSSPTSVEQSAVAYAVSKGVVVVAAMGNDGSGNPSYPAAYNDVVSVGAIDSADARASFSQTGAHIDVVAPGVQILSTVPGGGYGFMSGTSMATPHVAGVAALIRSVKPSASVAEVTDILRTTARNLRDTPSDPIPNNAYGWGLVDALAAVDKASPRIIRTLESWCSIPITRSIVCPNTTSAVYCQVVRTVRINECLPRTAICPVKTPLCGVTITTTPQTPLTPIATLRPGSYDPYGYFSQDASGTADAGQAEGGDAYAAGYAAGYEAALAELAQQGWFGGYGPDQGQDADASEGVQQPSESSAAGVPPLPLTVPPIACGIPTVSWLCPPRTVPWQCPPRSLTCPPRTSLVVNCPPRTATCTLPPQCPITVTPTTTITVTPTTPYQGGGWYGPGQSPYGQSPFEG